MGFNPSAPKCESSGVVKSKQICEVGASTSFGTLKSNWEKAHPTYIFPNNRNVLFIPYSVGKQGFVNEMGGYIVASPVDKSKTIVKSASNDFFDNRDFDSGMIERAYTCTSKGAAYSSTCGLNGEQFSDFTIVSDKIMILEFN